MNGNGNINNVSDDIHRLFAIGPVIFIKWANRRKWEIEYISPNISRLGYRQEDFVEKKITLSDIVHVDDARELAVNLEKLEQNRDSLDFCEGQLRLMTECGDCRGLYHYTVSTGHFDKNEDYYYGYFVEMAGHKLTKAGNKSRIEYQAYHDLLTGLPNRALFNDRLALEINRTGRSRQKFAVMFLDLDEFKIINDSLGHLTGDLILKEAANRLLKCIRNGDTVSRVGGDEFTVLLPQITDPKEIVIVAQRILKVFKEPFFVHHHELFSTISIGICIFPSDGKNAVELLKNSDLAMYHAKELGKNNYVFFSCEMNVEIKKRLDLENQLWHALNEKQFVLLYQPVLELKSGSIVGVEALVRWNHPDSGLISPCDFIPLAEETGMILQLGQWVLETGCRQNFEWQKKGMNSVYVSINISSKQFLRNDFLKCIRKALKKTGLDTGSLTLQITENGIFGMGKQEKMIRIMKALRKFGIKLSIDDFGMGFSSLNNLKSFPVDTLKIDRSFVKGIPHDPDSVAIARSIISLSKNLKMFVLAEGVENEEQLDFFVTNRCDLIQGYYFSPPAPPEEIFRMVSEKKNLYK